MANDLTDLFPQEDPTITGRILWTLGLLDRPRNALATATKYGLSEDPDKTFWQGLGRGFMDDEQTSWGDVAGIEQTSENDSWEDYIKKGGSRLALDVIGDPLNLLFAPAKAAGLVGRGVKALGVPTGKSIAGLGARALGSERLTDAIAGTSLGKAFMHRLPSSDANDAIERMFTAGQRRAGEERQITEDLVNPAREAIEKSGMDPLEVREMFERYGVLPDDIESTIRPLHQRASDKMGELRPLQERFGIEPMEALSEADVQRVPRLLTAEGRRLVEQGPGARKGTTRVGVRNIAAPEQFGSRELKLLDVTGEGGKPIVMKPEFLDQDPVTNQFLYKGQPVNLSEATLQDIYKSGAMQPGSFVEDMPLSFYGDIQKKTNQVEYLRMLQTLEDNGALIKLERGEVPAKGFREVNVPGLDGYVAKKSVANRLENLASAQFDPDTPIGAVGEILKSMNDTTLGRGLSKFTQAWKRTILPLHPGYHAGNIGSNFFQSYLGDVNPAMVVPRTLEGLGAYLGKHQPIEGLDLMKEAGARGFERSGFFGNEARDALTEAIEGGGTPTLDKLGRAGWPLRKIAEGHNWLIENVGQPLGQGAETSAKLGVMIDYLKKRPDFATASPEIKAQILDDAAQFAHRSLIDYRASTPFENQLLNVVPFYKWQRGIAGKTAQDVVNQPQKLANIERFLEATMMPMDPEEKALQDPWVQEQAPIVGLLGHRFAPAESTGNPTMVLAGRYEPHGNLEQAAKRPKDFLQSIINPAIKAPYELATNYSSFKDRNIDELAGSFPENLINPITGGPSSQASQTMFGLPLPAAYDYILSQIPGGRYLQEAHQAGLSAGLWEDPYKESFAPQELATWYASGGKKYQYDIAAAMTRRQREYDRKISAFRHDMNYALVKGDTRRWEKTYAQMIEFMARTPGAWSHGE